MADSSADKPPPASGTAMAAAPSDNDTAAVTATPSDSGTADQSSETLPAAPVEEEAAAVVDSAVLPDQSD